jgi:2-hydroxychromene-2-carboxylate isomerase
MARPETSPIDYYYSPISAFAYLGEGELRRIAKRHRQAIRYLPIDLDRVRAELGLVMPVDLAEARRSYRLVELNRWSRQRRLEIRLKPLHWPIASPLAARLIHAAELTGLDPGPLSQALLRAVWCEDRNIADLGDLRDLVDTAGFDPDKLLALADTNAVIERFEAATQAAIRRGVFGSPTYFWRGEMFFGQDRLDFLDRAIAAARRAERPR